MNLSVKDASALLTVSEKTIYRWIQQGAIPVYKVRGSYRFNRAELIEWATSRRIGISADAHAEPEEDARPLPQLRDALEAGGIIYRLEGRNRDEVLRSLVRDLRLPEEVDRHYLQQVLIARENLASTACGDGVALPHPRSPGLLNLNRPTLTLAFLEHPVDFGALDGLPVRVLFVPLAPTLRAHLHLLRQVAHVLHDPQVREVLGRQGSREEIFAVLERSAGTRTETR
ncbi:phosphotransferase IIA-like nitrogen-regulatory protein PtsN [Geothermobacter ehrlichii]|uniref:Phosphotransferase IIA-like nitrogen-regulatory protein PtsN n=1 Tax=Geothermobacter ehrlichii TaxID=213224 RepID=A0A5D3WR93_9BACT|nr:PTS sugar transporter subunit IIA [Geothermobacter ehrlichii]TYP00109.1 phosphotransferase IIA-like nitrogen-regulatory protein PtsN [Geothermobacter ehrlichii]